MSSQSGSAQEKVAEQGQATEIISGNEGDIEVLGTNLIQYLFYSIETPMLMK
jgi:hypothetical protein